MISASAQVRRAGSAAEMASGLSSALTRSSVWNVEISGTSSSCFRRWPARPDSQ